MRRLLKQKRVGIQPVRCMPTNFQSFDIETTGLKPHSDAVIFSWCRGFNDGTVDVYRGYDKYLNKLQDFFNDTGIEKIAHNYKFELSFLKKHGINTAGTIWHDTMIMSQLLRNNAPSHRLEDLCSELCGYVLDDDPKNKDLDERVTLQARARGKRYDRVDKHLFHEYQRADGQRPILLFNTFYPEILKDEKLYQDYLNEIKFIKVCERMEEYGIQVDINECKELIDWLSKELNKIQIEAKKIIGRFINLNSDPQIRRLIYTQYGLPILGYTKKAKLPSTNKEILMELMDKYPEHEKVLRLIIKCKSYTTGRSTIKGYLNLKNDDDIIHAVINSNIARTGRPSCKQPNLLNVPKEEVLKNLYPVPARKCLRTKEKKILYFSDYGGLQMRLIADACGETEMLKIISKNGDIHGIPTELLYSGYSQETGHIITKKKLNEKEWKKYRGAAKNGHFALPFGSSPGKMAKVLDLTIKQALDGIEAYCGRFPRVAGYSGSQKSNVRRFGYVLTPFGRRLNVPKRQAYIGANYYIQGTEAGLMKRALNKIDRYFNTVWKDRIRLILDIYDEIIFSVPVSIAKKYESKIIKDVSNYMTNIEEIKVRLDTEWKKSEGTWFDAEPIEMEMEG